MIFSEMVLSSSPARAGAAVIARLTQKGTIASRAARIVLDEFRTIKPLASVRRIAFFLSKISRGPTCWAPNLTHRQAQDQRVSAGIRALLRRVSLAMNHTAGPQLRQQSQ